MKKAQFSNLLRTFGLLLITDKIRYYILYIKRYSRIQSFLKANSSIKLPPSYLIYESFALDYDKYYFDGSDSASWLIERLKKYISFNEINILDWGCGPARIVRHIPELLNNSCSIYGTDYNQKSIIWNRENIQNVNFNLNFSNPPLPYVSNSFDIIYGISIFTHLPEDMHYRWFEELVRVTKNNGIIFLTLHGAAFRTKLTDKEVLRYDNGELIIKGNTKIGHRTFAAFHPKSFILKLFSGHELLEHYEGKVKNGKPEQDTWIIRVRK